MPSRTIAIGDIHGCSAALHAVLEAVDPKPDDTIVTLGDYVDRGEGVREAIDELLALAKRCRLVPILGNHDEMLLAILDGQRELFLEWLSYGGDVTLFSYGAAVPEQIPPAHGEFLRSCRPYWETDGHFFVHASYRADRPLDEQPPKVLRWEPLRGRKPGPHQSGKLAIVGHTSQKDGEILDLGYLKCIDTCCYGDGWLTAMDIDTGRVWQADQCGRMRMVIADC